jgi:hypothetical protein
MDVLGKMRDRVDTFTDDSHVYQEVFRFINYIKHESKKVASNAPSLHIR